MVTLDKVHKLVRNKLHTDMKNHNAISRMQDFLANYHMLLPRNGLKWLIKDNSKISAEHVLFAIKPYTLHDRLDVNFSFAKYELSKCFHDFLKHAICLAEAFQIVDSGPTSLGGPNDTSNSYHTKRNGGGRRKDRVGRSRNGGRSELGAGSSPAGAYTETHNEELPLCLWDPLSYQGLRHLFKACGACPPEERQRLYAKRAEEFACDGSSKGTRSQTKKTTNADAGKNRQAFNDRPTQAGYQCFQLALLSNRSQ